MNATNIHFSQTTVNGMKIVQMTKSSKLNPRKKVVVNIARYPVDVVGVDLN